MIDDFIREAGVVDPYQVRIARKFGLVYAAGIIAATKDWMPWKADFVFDVVSHLMQRALRTIGEDVTPLKVVHALAKAVEDRRKIPVLGNNRRLKLKEGRPFHGFRYRKGGRDFLALRREALPELVGVSDTSERLARILAKEGVLEPGHGGKLTQQVPFTLISSQGEDRKSVRMVVIQTDKLQNKARESNV